MPEEKKPATVNYAGNSHKSKEAAQKERVPLKKVIDGEATQRKKGLGRKVADTFAGDDVKSVGSYILIDVFIPALKTMISDAASQGVERMLFGESRPRSRSAVGGMRTNYTSYNRVSSPLGGAPEPRTISRSARANHDFAEVILQTRGEAELVLENLQIQIEQYGVAQVADLYDLVEITSSFTDNKWGWTDLRDARIRRLGSQGFLLDLPRTVPID